MYTVKNMHADLIRSISKLPKFKAVKIDLSYFGKKGVLAAPQTTRKCPLFFNKKKEIEKARASTKKSARTRE
jgi:hypothetical protein